MYQALYRKWRPQRFDDVIGQQHITESLKSQVETGHLSHAYIFIGTRGTGKTTCARILAKAVNCEHPVNGNPCCECASCRGIAEGTVMDVVELDAASNNSVDNVRSLREEAIFSPANVKKRVYIIDEVHMLSTSAFNALLKILEEPPAHLMFILCTTELQKVPATILSRCQRHSFKRIETNVLSSYLQTIAEREKISLTREASDLLAGLAEGGVRDALSMLDQCSSYKTIGAEEVYSAIGLAGNRRIEQLFSSLVSHDTDAALSLFQALWKEGKDPASVLRELSTLIRDVLMLKVAPLSAGNLIYGGYERNVLISYGAASTTDELLCMLETVQNAIASMKDRANSKTAAEICLISLAENALGDSVANLKARISALEEAVKSGITMQSAPVNRRPSALYSAEKSAYDADSSELDTDQAGCCEQNESEEEGDFPPPEMFTEEQPEDVFLQKSRNKQAAQIETNMAVEQQRQTPQQIAEAQEESHSDNDGGALWQKILKNENKAIPPYVMGCLDPAKINGVLEGNILSIQVQTELQKGNLSKAGNIAILTAEASRIAGRPIECRVVRMSAKTASRSLEELSKFPEVKFIN